MPTENESRERNCTGLMLTRIEELPSVHAAFPSIKDEYDLIVVVTGFTSQDSIDQLSALGFDLHSLYTTESGQTGLNLKQISK